jgi:hypothetical protein
LYSEDHANIATSFSHLGFALYSLGEWNNNKDCQVKAY